jgi:hypothetical protein
MIKLRLLTSVMICLSASAALATCPLLDNIEYRGKVYSLARYTNPPFSQKAMEWVRSLPPCSAIGQGRAFYRIDGDKVFLTKYTGCASALSVADAFEQQEPQLLATWLSGKIDVALGRCNGGWDPAKESFVIENGKLIEFIKLP